MEDISVTPDSALENIYVRTPVVWPNARLHEATAGCSAAAAVCSGENLQTNIHT